MFQYFKRSGRQNNNMDESSDIVSSHVNVSDSAPILNLSGSHSGVHHDLRTNIVTDDGINSLFLFYSLFLFNSHSYSH